VPVGRPLPRRAARSVTSDAGQLCCVAVLTIPIDFTRKIAIMAPSHESTAPVPKRVLSFGPGEVPAGLLRDHTLKAGTWGLLQVVAGRVVFIDHEERRTELLAGAQRVIRPVAPHRIEPSADATIQIAFYDAEPSAS